MMALCLLAVSAGSGLCVERCSENPVEQTGDACSRQVCFLSSHELQGLGSWHDIGMGSNAVLVSSEAIATRLQLTPDADAS